LINFNSPLPGEPPRGFKTIKKMKNKKFVNRYFSVEEYYDAAREKMEAFRAIEKERFLDPWEEAEKEGARMDLERYGRILEEEEEENRRQICESQGLSRWC